MIPFNGCKNPLIFKKLSVTSVTPLMAHKHHKQENDVEERGWEAKVGSKLPRDQVADFASPRGPYILELLGFQSKP